MKQKYKLRHRFTALLLAFMLCLSSFAAPPAFAMEDGHADSASVGVSEPAPEVSSTLENAKTAPEADSEASDTTSGEYLGKEPANEDDMTLSTEARSFIASVDALDREAILAAVNQWAVASQDWQADQDDPDLTAALEEATAASD